MKKSRVFSILLPLTAVLFCVALYFLLFWRYDAFPWEKRAAKNIEQAAYGANYKNRDLDYCIPHPSSPVCSEDFFYAYPPGTECYIPKCRWGHVATLHLLERQLAAVPLEIVELPALMELDLSGNRLTSLPPEIGQLHNLRYLALSDNQLTNLPPEIGQLHNLKYLYLSGNQLTDLPPEIGQMRNLTNLNLSGNRLTSLPPEIEGLRSLRTLNLSGNRLTSLQPEIGLLTKLESLDVSGNPLSGPLPNFLVNLPLSHFDFSTTDLCIPLDEDIQAWLRRVSSKYDSPLSFDFTCSMATQDQTALLALYKIPGHPADWSTDTSPCTWSGVRCDWTGRVIALELRNTQLIGLPQEIGLLVDLQFLFLPNNRLTELPPEIGQLRNLIHLELAGNQLTGLPPEIGQLSRLQTLELRKNRLTGLPPEIGQLGSLQYLYLPDNRLTELPPEIGLLANLKFMDVSANPLSGPLPAFLVEMPNLQFIFVDTGLCIPNDEATLIWLRRQSGIIEYVNGEFVQVDPETVLRGFLERSGCK